MLCPYLKQLPNPPISKTDWPWTQESPQLPVRMPYGSNWPKISIVTPSFNQGKFIEETIRSVLLQGYPNFEYIIIDGGSTDGSLEIIKKYAKWITYSVSESDNGQTHAINKGFKRATGEIVAWLNSDDYYQYSTLSCIAKFFANNDQVDFIYGDLKWVDGNGKTFGKLVPDEFDIIKLLFYCLIPQQSCFWRSSVFKDIGYLNEKYYLW